MGNSVCTCKEQVPESKNEMDGRLAFRPLEYSKPAASSASLSQVSSSMASSRVDLGLNPQGYLAQNRNHHSTCLVQVPPAAKAKEKEDHPHPETIVGPRKKVPEEQKYEEEVEDEYEHEHKTKNEKGRQACEKGGGDIIPEPEVEVEAEPDAVVAENSRKKDPQEIPQIKANLDVNSREQNLLLGNKAPGAQFGEDSNIRGLSANKASPKFSLSNSEAKNLGLDVVPCPGPECEVSPIENKKQSSNEQEAEAEEALRGLVEEATKRKSAADADLLPPTLVLPKNRAVDSVPLHSKTESRRTVRNQAATQRGQEEGNREDRGGGEDAVRGRR